MPGTMISNSHKFISVNYSKYPEEGAFITVFNRGELKVGGDLGKQ